MFNGKLHPYQEEVVKRFLERKSLLLAYGCGTGKAQSISEPVLTPNGWKEIGKLQVGDYVIGKGGKPTEVTGVFPQTDRSIYKITMNDGSYTFATKDHLWSVRRRAKDNWHVKTTQELLDSGLSIQRKSHDVRTNGRASDAPGCKYQIPVVDAVAFGYSKLPVDPYLLGAILGDGCVTASNPTITFSTADSEMISNMEVLLPDGVSIKKGDGYNYRLVSTRGKPNLLLDAVRSLGIYGTDSSTKFIPENYLMACTPDRIALLQGLMDTDGTVDKRQPSSISFCTVSEALKDGVVELVQSLGGTARVTSKIPVLKYKGEYKKGKLAYMVSIRLPSAVQPFRLTRKEAPYTPVNNLTRYIKTIEYSHEEDSVCISVAAEDNLYVTRNYIVTHNTVMSIAIAEELLASGEVDQVLVLCPASLKYQWRDKIKQFTDSSVMVVDGPKRIRTGQYASQRGEIPACEYLIGSYDGVIYDHEDMSAVNPGMVIADEVSAIKSFKAQRSKRVKKLFGKTPYRLGLTATPIENKPEELYSIMQWIDPTVLGRYDLFERAYITRNSKGWVVEYKNLDVLRERMGDALSRKTRHDPEVRPYLPDVDEATWEVHIDSIPLGKAYEKICQDMLSHIEENAYKYDSDINLMNMVPGFDDSTPDGELMSMHMCAEMLLNHPELVIWSANMYEGDSPEGSAYAKHLKDSGLLYSIHNSPKMDLLLEELDLLLADPDSKVIIVSRYKYMLDIISMHLKGEYKHVKFTGDMTATQKNIAVGLFSQPEYRIFLTSHAGGYGLDLYMADYLINYDIPWSAGTKDQINSRHVRASSGFDKVYVRNLVTKDTVEERKYRVLERKGQIISSVMDGADITTVDVGSDYLRTHLEKVLGKPLTDRAARAKLGSSQFTEEAS